MSGGKTNDQEHKETVAGADPADGAATPAETSKPATGSSPLEADNADLKDRLLRALAECENVRRRGELLASDARRSAIAEFAREVLTVADNLHRAIEAATLAPTKPTAEASVIEGVRATERTLAKNSVCTESALWEWPSIRTCTRRCSSCKTTNIRPERLLR